MGMYPPQPALVGLPGASLSLLKLQEDFVF